MDVIYGEAKSELEVYAQTFRTLRFLETIAELATDRFAWRAPIMMEMRSCGGVGARWTISTRPLHICYEMAQDFADLYRDYAQNRQRPQPKQIMFAPLPGQPRFELRRVAARSLFGCRANSLSHSRDAARFSSRANPSS